MMQKTVISCSFSVGLLEPSPWLPASLSVGFDGGFSLLSCSLPPGPIEVSAPAARGCLPPSGAPEASVEDGGSHASCPSRRCPQQRWWV